MKLNWFKRRGLIFIPATLIAWIIFAIGIAFAVHAFIHIDSRSHSVSDTLDSFFIVLLMEVIVYSGIAFFTSRTNKG